jgi:hypothetical protein
MLVDSKPLMSSMRSTLRNPDRWKWFSGDLEAKRGILSRLEGIKV